VQFILEPCVILGMSAALFAATAKKKKLT